MQRIEKKHMFLETYERNLYVFVLGLRYFSMKKHIFQPFKIPHPSRYETYLPLLTCDKRYNTLCSSAPRLDLALGSGQVGSPYYSRLCIRLIICRTRMNVFPLHPFE